MGIFANLINAEHVATKRKEQVMQKHEVQERYPDMDYLISQYGTSLLRMAMAFLGDFHLAQDAVQETYIKAYNNYHTFRSDASEKTWLMRIAINTCKDMRKSAWYRKISLKQPAEMWEFAANDNTHESDNNDMVEAIRHLTPKLKEVVLLFYYQELSITEISHILNTSQNTVRVRLNRARAKLKQVLTEGSSINDYEQCKACN